MVGIFGCFFVLNNMHVNGGKPVFTACVNASGGTYSICQIGELFKYSLRKDF